MQYWSGVLVLLSHPSTSSLLCCCLPGTVWFTDCWLYLFYGFWLYGQILDHRARRSAQNPTAKCFDFNVTGLLKKDPFCVTNVCKSRQHGWMLVFIHLQEKVQLKYLNLAINGSGFLKCSSAPHTNHKTFVCIGVCVDMFKNVGFYWLYFHLI